MTKYLFVYRNPVTDAPREAPSPEQMQQMMSQWSNWKEKFKAQVLDVGDGLQPQGRVLKDGKVTDGPFTEAKEILAGYSIVSADSFDSALEVARECPFNHMPGARIEIRPIMEY